MAPLSFFVGVLGNVTSIFVFASPIKTFRRVVKNKSTEDFKGIPYVTTLLSTSLWTYYGLLKPGGLLIVTINAAGSVLQLIYVLLYLSYAPKDKKVRMGKLALVLNVGVYATVVLVTMFALHGNTRLLVIGSLCAGFTVGMYASPMTAMRNVVRTKSVEFMPFFLSFFLFLNGGVWSVYAYLVRDYFIGVPNAIGFLLGAIQLVLYIMYKRKSQEKYEEKADEEQDATSRVETEGCKK